jgi:hypothetical protein
VSTGVPSRPALQRRPLLETSYDSITGKVHPPSPRGFPADPQVSSIAPGCQGEHHYSGKARTTLRIVR